MPEGLLRQTVVRFANHSYPRELAGSDFRSAANDLYQSAARRHNTAARPGKHAFNPRFTALRRAENRIGRAVVRMTSNKQGVLT